MKTYVCGELKTHHI